MKWIARIVAVAWMVWGAVVASPYAFERAMDDPRSGGLLAALVEVANGFSWFYGLPAAALLLASRHTPSSWYRVLWNVFSAFAFVGVAGLPTVALLEGHPRFFLYTLVATTIGVGLVVALLFALIRWRVGAQRKDDPVLAGTSVAGAVLLPLAFALEVGMAAIGLAFMVVIFAVGLVLTPFTRKRKSPSL